MAMSQFEKALLSELKGIRKALEKLKPYEDKRQKVVVDGIKEALNGGVTISPVYSPLGRRQEI